MSVSGVLYDCQGGGAADGDDDNATFTCARGLGIMLETVPELASESLTWLWALVASMLVGCSGVLPLLVIPIDQTSDLKQGDSANTLKTLLSFAVGGLLGDVFLHSLPEIWANDVAKNGGKQPSTYSGLLILSGLIVFVVVEKVFTVITRISQTQSVPSAVVEKLNNNNKGYVKPTEKTDDDANKGKHITGYLNLIANMIDNFAHGLSLGGAFLVSFRVGCLTTFAILVHEIPHEVGDFAILLKSGFSRWDAARFQLVTAGGGLVGAFAAIAFSGASNSIGENVVDPSVHGGTFLHIGLVTVLPDLLKEENPKESVKQLSALILGIAIMACASTVLE